MKNYDYKTQLIEDIKKLANDNKEEVRKWLEDEVDLKDEISDVAWADYLTGNGSGSYYCNSAKAEEQVKNSGILTNRDFLNYLRDNETHLEDLFEKGYETLDVWARCYYLDYAVSDEEIAEALKEGLKEK